VSSGTAYRQFPHLLQDSFDLSVQLASGIIFPDGIIKVPLHATEFLVTLFRELALYTDHGFERGIEVRDAQTEELREFGDELIVEEIKDLFGFIVFLLSFGKSCRVVTGLCEGFVELAARGVVI
jgi:hypothetical protein